MKRLRLFNPFRIREVVRQIRRASGGGGPAAIRLAGVGQPTGFLVPTARLNVEVTAKDGTVTRFKPDVPIPFPYAWAYRIARKLGVPLVSKFDPERLDLSVDVPGR